MRITAIIIGNYRVPVAGDGVRKAETRRTSAILTGKVTEADTSIVLSGVKVLKIPMPA